VPFAAAERGHGAYLQNPHFRATVMGCSRIAEHLS